MSDTRRIREVVQRLAGTQGTEGNYPVMCTVLTVDTDALTCTVESVNDGDVYELDNVRLMACVDDGFLLLPVVGSNVIVNKNDRGLPFVEMFSELTNVYVTAPATQFNDGSFGGMVKGTEFLTQTTKLVNLLTAIFDVLTGAPIDEPGNGAPSALQAALNAALAGQQVPDFSNSVNTLITHGQ
jgi:hypothetical protein